MEKNIAICIATLHFIMYIKPVGFVYQYQEIVTNSSYITP